MSSFIYFYLLFFIINVDKSFSDADHVLTAETSFSVFTPWTDPNAVNTVLLELPKDKKRATSHDNLPHGEDQIMIRIRIGPSHNVGPVEKYLVINDVYDPKRQTKDKALVPYVIEVMRGEPVITYSMDYIEDVKFNDYNEHSSHNSKKNFHHASSSTESKGSDEKEEYKPASDKGSSPKEYKPAMDRLNAVMKKLTEIFESENKKSDTEAEVYAKVQENEEGSDQVEKEQIEKMNEATKKPLLHAKESKNLEELKNDFIKNSIPESNNFPLEENYPYNGHQLENSCLKRHVFENWKNQNAFQKHEKNFKFKKNLNMDRRNFNAPLQKNPGLLIQRQSIIANGENSGNRAISKQPTRDASNHLRRLFQKLHGRSPEKLTQDGLSEKQTPENTIDLGLNDIEEKELIRIIRGALEPLRHKEHKPEGVEGPSQTETLLGPAYESPPISQVLKKPRSYRKKRSTLESGSHRYYKNDETPESDQCDKTKIFQDNDFDLQSCDTCGGKSKKPQKPPHIINANAHVAQKRRDTFTKKPERREEVSKSEPCLCRTHQSACICCSGKKFRSHHDPVRFSAFGLNSPMAFVTSRIRIFRKRRGLWWEVAPPTNLNSMTGVFSDGNFSFSFSSPIELFQLEKALRLQDQKLLFPISSSEEPSDENPNDISAEAIEANILNSRTLKSNPSLVMTMNRKAAPHKKSAIDLRPLTDFGFFPTTMNAIEKCPYNDKRLCLNMLTDEAPASTFKVQMPFRDNVLIHKNTIRIQISNIITDATTKDAMQISVLVVNKGVKSRLVMLNINNCPTVSDSSLTEAKTLVQKMLMPNIAETATFLLPLIQQATTKHKKFECLVEVSTKISDGATGRVTRRYHDVGMKIVSKRKFLVEPEKRCLCIWHCACHCIPKLVPYSDYKMCQKMSLSERRQAGFPKGSGQGFSDGQDTRSATDIFFSFLKYASYLLLLMLILGLLKAILGLVSPAIDRWAFDYVYPNPNYVNSSRARRFFGNVLLFVIFPFRFLCTCFTPSPEDLLVASSEWQCCQTQGPMCEDEFDDPDLLIVQNKNQTKNSSKTKPRLVSGIESKQQELSKRLSRLSLAFQQQFTDDEWSPKKAPKSACEIVKTLSERRDLRRKSRQNLPTSATTARDNLATELVQSLLDAKRVYRTIKEPIGNVSKIPHGVKYCIQGYFVATLDAGYEFVSFQPLVQYRGIVAETFCTKELHPPIFLSSVAFNRRYSNEVAVLKSGDVTVHPPDNVPCINVRVIDDATDTETSSTTSNQREISRREPRSSLKRCQH